MKIIIAPDSFKGSLTNLQAAQAMQEAVLAVFPEAKTAVLPISDGGEGAAEVLSSALSGKMYRAKVHGPYGRIVDAGYFLSDDGLGIVELAQAAGLMLVQPQERSPIFSSTLGVGELMMDALQAGAKSLCLTLGGSATNDGGAGIAKAMGIRLLDCKGEELPPTCEGIGRLSLIDVSRLDARVSSVPIHIACDVKNPLCGPYGASYIYGPQKGASPEMIREMDDILSRYAKLLCSASKKENLALLPGSGAAGGAALPLLAFCNAKLCSGIDFILDALQFDSHLSQAALLLTGEGKIDMQTSHGKAIDGLIRRAEKYGVPVAAFAGRLELGENAYPKADVRFYEINPKGQPIEESIVQAYTNLRSACIRALENFR